MYVKIFTQILDSSLAENRRLRHFFIDLLLCSDADGNVMMTNTAIARRISADMEEVEWGLEGLQKPDPLSGTPDYDGKRIIPLEGHGYGWKIVNYERYRDIKSDEQKRRETAERVRRWRARQNGELDPSDSELNLDPTSTVNEAPRPKKSVEADPDFDIFWAAYPRKVGKEMAMKAWRKNDRPELAVILSSLEAQKQMDGWKKDGGKFIPYPASWINGKRWQDSTKVEIGLPKCF